MIICDISHLTEVAGSAKVELQSKDGKVIKNMELNLCTEAVNALVDDDWDTIARLIRDAVTLYPTSSASKAQVVEDAPVAPTTKTRRTRSPRGEARGSGLSNGTPEVPRRRRRTVEAPKQDEPSDFDANEAPQGAEVPVPSVDNQVDNSTDLQSAGTATEVAQEQRKMPRPSKQDEPSDFNADEALKGAEVPAQAAGPQVDGGPDIQGAGTSTEVAQEQRKMPKPLDAEETPEGGAKGAKDTLDLSLANGTAVPPQSSHLDDAPSEDVDVPVAVLQGDDDEYLSHYENDFNDDDHKASAIDAGDRIRRAWKAEFDNDDDDSFLDGF